MDVAIRLINLIFEKNFSSKDSKNYNTDQFDNLIFKHYNTKNIIITELGSDINNNTIEKISINEKIIDDVIYMKLFFFLFILFIFFSK